MIIKEYRVVMPVSVEEYQVAQRYMVAKLSTQQTGAVSSPSVFFLGSADSFAGGGEGVTVLTNEPFADHPELGSGQYTKKIYHIASKLPGWLRSVLPTKATELHEEAWNALAPLP